MMRAPALRGPRAPRRMAMLAYPGAQMLDITGPLEVFARSARLLLEQGLRANSVYEVEVIAAQAGPVKTSSGVEILAARPLTAVQAPLDTLLVAGGVGSREALRSSLVLGFLRRMAPRVRRLASVCTGAFLLAEAGLLNGRRATTHWAYCAELAKRYPQVQVEPDPIFVRDGRIYTSAGVTAGMDLALGLVEEDLGQVHPGGGARGGVDPPVADEDRIGFDLDLRVTLRELSAVRPVRRGTPSVQESCLCQQKSPCTHGSKAPDPRRHAPQKSEHEGAAQGLPRTYTARDEQRVKGSLHRSEGTRRQDLDPARRLHRSRLCCDYLHLVDGIRTQPLLQQKASAPRKDLQGARDVEHLRSRVGEHCHPARRAGPSKCGSSHHGVSIVPPEAVCNDIQPINSAKPLRQGFGRGPCSTTRWR